MAYKDLCFVDMFGQGKLNKNAVDLGILVVLVDQFQQFLFRQGFRLIVLDRIKSQLLGGLLLCRHIAHRGSVLAHKDCHKAWNHVIFLFELSHFLCQFLPDLFCDFIAANQFCSHLSLPSSLENNLPNPPNPPLPKGGEGGFSWFVSGLTAMTD